MFLFSYKILENLLSNKNIHYNSLNQNSEYRSGCYFRANYFCKISSVRY